MELKYKNSKKIQRLLFETIAAIMQFIYVIDFYNQYLVAEPQNNDYDLIL